MLDPRLMGVSVSDQDIQCSFGALDLALGTPLPLHRVRTA